MPKNDCKTGGKMINFQIYAGIKQEIITNNNRASIKMAIFDIFALYI
jgi:hypothetical protein